MAVKKDGNKNEKQNETMGWEQFDFFEEIERSSSQVIESQKEWVTGVKEQFEQLEENSKKAVTEWKTEAQAYFTENKQQLAGEDYQKWFNQLEAIGHKSQQIAFLPGKNSLDLLSQSTEQNKKVHEEFTEAFEGVVEQMKQTQKELFSFFPFNPIASK